MKSIKFFALGILFILIFLFVVYFTAQKSFFYFKFYNSKNQSIKYYNLQSPVETHMIWDNYHSNHLINDYSEIIFHSHVSKLLDKKKYSKLESDLVKFKEIYPNFLLNKNSVYYNQSLPVLNKNLNIFFSNNNDFVNGSVLFFSKKDGLIIFEKKEIILKNINFINAFILFKFLTNNKITKCDKFEEFRNFYILDNCIKQKNNGDFEYVIQMKLLKNNSQNINNVILDQFSIGLIHKFLFIIIFFFVGLYLIKKLYMLNDNKF
jgi:hypothetical protein